MVLTLVFMIFANIFFQLLAMSCRTVQQVQSVSVIVLFLMTLFGGFIVYPIAMPPWLGWIKWVNPFYHAYEGFLRIEFTSSKYEDTSTCKPPLSYLTERGFVGNRSRIGISFLFMILYTLLATILLALVSRYVRFQEIKHKKKLPEESYEETTEINVPFTKINLTFEDICYDVQTSTGDETLRLLNNVSGAMMAGRMCALMGSSGAGKTTLMVCILLSYAKQVEIKCTNIISFKC